jgi:hypothetical protein
MSASDRATARRWALSSLHGAEVLGVPAVAVAARCPLLLLQPAATNPSTATASATAPVAVGEPAAAGKGNRDILAELSGDVVPQTALDAARAQPIPCDVTAQDPRHSSGIRCAATEQGGSAMLSRQTLFVTARTVEGHLTSVFRKLRVHSRDELPAALAGRASVPA